MRFQVKIRTIQERKNVMMGKDRILIREKMQAAEKSLNECLNLALVVFFGGAGGGGRTATKQEILSIVSKVG